MKYENTLLVGSLLLLVYFLKLGILRVEGVSDERPKGLSNDEEA